MISFLISMVFGGTVGGLIAEYEICNGRVMLRWKPYVMLIGAVLLLCIAEVLVNNIVYSGVLPLEVIALLVAFYCLLWATHESMLLTSRNTHLEKAERKRRDPADPDAVGRIEFSGNTMILRLRYKLLNTCNRVVVVQPFGKSVEIRLRVPSCLQSKKDTSPKSK